LFAKFLNAGRAPGVAYGVVIDGKLVHGGGAGTLHVGEDHKPRPDSIFRIASMTKSFLAATVLLLRDEGVLRLDDKVERWVPELRGLPLATGDSAPPTLRQLLSMNAGYPEDDPWADRLESLAEDQYTALVGKPKSFSRTSGVAFEYSNFGFTLLGRVVQNATGRPFRDVVSERIIAPLGLTSTTWSDEGADPARLATGYALIDGAWVAQPIQAPGEFSALGGLYSTVADLAVWVAGFIDAWPPRDRGDTHPLSRASRREMQQVCTMMPLQIGRHGEGLLRAQVHGYCMGLVSTEDLVTGRTMGHSGGYPGFGSNMTWHPVSRIGVIALANGRYAGPGGAVGGALAALVARSLPHLRMEAHPALWGIQQTINDALAAGDFTPIKPLLAGNVALDEDLSRRAAQVAGLAKIHGDLIPEDGLNLTAPMNAEWWLSGRHGRVGVRIMLSPEHPPKVQSLALTSVQPAPADLEAAVVAALKRLEQGTEFSGIVLPIQRRSWIACDGKRAGTVLLEGASANILVNIDLDSVHVATFVPEGRKALQA